MMYRLADTLIALFTACAFGAMLWFTGTMLIDNIMFLATGLNVSLMVYTWALAVICMILGLLTLAGGVSAGFAAAGKLRLDF